MTRSEGTAPVLAAGSRWGQAYADLLRTWIESNGPAWVPLRGRSMAPFLEDGSRVLVASRRTGLISPGDLVVYEVEGSVICHRVLGRRRLAEGHAFLVKGDSRPRFDPWIPEERVIGQVLAVDYGDWRVDLRTPVRRAQALAAAARSGLTAGWRLVLRRAARSIGGASRCVGAS